MLPPADRQSAYVLHRRAFRETSAIVDLLTLDYGRVSGVIRGVKGARRDGNHIEPFAPVVATWRGRGQLVNLLRCEALGRSALAGEGLFAGLYLNELLVRLLSRDEPVQGLFQHYGEALSRIAAGGIESALRVFERRLLEELGYGLAFDVDIETGHAIVRGAIYRVVAGEGFGKSVDGSRCRFDTNGHQRELLLTGAQIAAIGADDYADAGVRRAAKQVFRRALDRRLDGRALATRQLFAARAGGQRRGADGRNGMRA